MKPIFASALLAAALLSFSASHSGAATNVVTVTSEDGWFGVNEGPFSSVGDVVFGPGPVIPPLGVGSASLIIDDTGRASLGTMEYAGTRLSGITQLAFESYSFSDLVVVSPALQFDVDYDSSDSSTLYQGRLTFEPSGAPVPDAWVAHDALAGTWWASQAPGNGVCPQSSPCTWAEVLSAFPNAAIRNDPIQHGALLFRLGGPIAGGSIASVDNLTIAIAGPSTTWDFEPGATINPSVGPAGSLVAIEAYGFRALRNARVVYYTNQRGPSRVKLCRARTSLSGAFSCAVSLPPAPTAGPAGVHIIRIKGARRVDYSTSFVLVP